MTVSNELINKVRFILSVDVDVYSDKEIGMLVEIIRDIDKEDAVK